MYIILSVDKNAKCSHADIVFIVPKMKVISYVAHRENLVKLVVMIMLLLANAIVS